MQQHTWLLTSSLMCYCQGRSLSVPEPDQRHAIDKENFMPTCNIAPRINFKMRPCALAQYSWLCLCHFMDLGLSAFKLPAHKTILRQMATVAFSAVGHKKRFRLLTQHVLPSEPLTYQHVQTSLRNGHCRCVLLPGCVRIDRCHATHPGEALRGPGDITVLRP